MAQEIKTRIVINAKPEEVWGILMDFNKYPSWNPFIKSISGKAEVGSRLKVELGDMTFKPTILSLEKNKKFIWLGHLLFPGLFDGEHRFYVSDNGDGTTVFEQSERFTGVLVPFLKKKLRTEVKSNFEEMNKALKSRME